MHTVTTNSTVLKINEQNLYVNRFLELASFWALLSYFRKSIPEKSDICSRKNEASSQPADVIDNLHNGQL